MSIEITDARARWQNQRQSLLRADYNHADEELARVLYFADHHPIVSRILHMLRSNSAYQTLDADVWIKEHEQARSTNLGFSLDEIERCAQSLKLLEWANAKFKSDSNGLWPLGSTTYGGSSTKFVDYIHSAIENLFDPLYYYVDAELRNLETLITPSDIINEIQSLVDNEVSLRYSETHKLLTDAYKHLFTLTSGSSGVSWYQIGFSCRTVLVKFGSEVFVPSYVPEGQDQPKEDDASNKLKWTARFLLKSVDAGDRYRESIEKIIQANWDFVSNIGHRQESVTEKDARLALIYTYLTISLIDRLMLDSGK
jgi:hypothetical protein